MCVVNPVTEIAKIAVDTVRLIQTVQVTAAENKVANYNAQQSINQAKIAEKNAVYERQEGIEDAREKRLQAIKNMGSTKTTLASGNISMSSLSALDLIEDEKISGEIDALKVKGDFLAQNRSALTMFSFSLIYLAFIFTAVVGTIIAIGRGSKISNPDVSTWPSTPCPQIAQTQIRSQQSQTEQQGLTPKPIFSCPKCGKGIILQANPNVEPSKCHGFYCPKCHFMFNWDPIVTIE